MKEQTLSLAFIGKSIVLAFVLWIGINVLLFRVLYGDTLTPIALPYVEDFEQTTRLDYRQFGGVWHIRDTKLIQTNTSGADLLAVIPLSLPRAQPYQFGAHIDILKGPNGAGLMFNLQHPDSVQQGQMIRFGENDGRKYLSYGYFDQKLKFVEQGSLTSPDITKGIELAVLVHKQIYDILVNGKVLQRDIPLQYSGGKVALTTWFSSAAFDNIYVVPVLPSFAAGDSAPEAATMTVTTGITSAISQAVSATPGAMEARSNFQKVTTGITPTTAITPAALGVFFSEKFSDKADKTRWIASSGEWRFEPGALVQQQLDGYDHSLLTVDQFSKFTLRTSFRHRKGSGGGVIFNMPDATTKSNGQMVRYFDKDDGLVWGYFDAKGVFVGQGHSPVAAPGDQLHTLQISADGATYLIKLDNKLVAENVPLVGKQGHIGLTASQSIVAFETFEVTALAPVQK